MYFSIGKLTKPIIVSLCSLSYVLFLFFGSHFVSPSSVEAQEDFFHKGEEQVLAITTE